MKLLVIAAVVLSLLLNATFAWLHLVSPETKEVADPVVGTERRVAAAGAPSVDRDVWPALSTKDLPEMVKRLRASGFPPAVVRAIMAAQVRESFAARRKAVQAASPEAPYWQNPQRDLKLAAALRDIDREEQRTLRELVGDPEMEDPMMRMTRERGLETLPAPKAEEVRKIIREYEDRRNDVYAAGYSMSDRDKITALEKEQRVAISRVLTPQELFEYDLRSSPTADMLREELSAFQPTEAEYRAIFPIRAAFDERFGIFGSPLSPEQMRERNEAGRLMTQQIKAVLSPDRAAEYDRATDYNYRRTSQLVARLELPPETTGQLYSVQKEFEQRRNDLYRGSAGGTDRARMVDQLKALQQEAETRVAPLLGGPRGVEAYKQFGGSWLAGMVPRLPPVTPAAPR